jgi:hypothetical protein
MLSGRYWRLRKSAYAFGFFGFRVSLPPLSFLPMRDAPFLCPYHRTFRPAMQRVPVAKRAVLYFVGYRRYRRRG